LKNSEVSPPAAKKIRSDEDDVVSLEADEGTSEKDPPTPPTELRLSLEEAFFLSYGLGCFVVKDTDGDGIGVCELWKQCVALSTEFISKYAVYHYLRSKGWVVKSGLKFGGDYLVYSKGPPFCHASYVALVIEEYSDRHNYSWNVLSALNREATAAGKEVLLCYVDCDNALKEEDLDSPNCLPAFTIKEVLFKRWVASEERQS